MPILACALVCLSLFTAGIHDADAEGLSILVGQEARIEQLSKEEVRDIYLARNSTHRFDLNPLDQEDETIRARFYRDVTGMSLSRVRAYWAKRVFTGRGRPPPTVTLDETARALDEDPKAITYVPADHKVANSKELFRSE